MEDTDNKLNFYYQLCHAFPHIYDINNRWAIPSSGKGWDKIIIELSREINDYVKDWEENNKPKVCQIKEKFGSLRFYLSTLDSFINTLIVKAENEANRTCEFCGSKENIETYSRGKRKYGWIKRLCANCSKEWEKPYGTS